jgi:hypothetical protein
VTQNRSFKQAVRERAARTGENYTTARRALMSDSNRAAPTDAIEAALRPGSVTASCAVAE